MKICIILATLAVSWGGSAIAQDVPTPLPAHPVPPVQPVTPPKNFEEHKANELQRIDMRIQNLQIEKSCIQAASTKEALKACHVQMREKMEIEKKR